MTSSNQTDFYLNFEHLGKLKLQARNQSEEAGVAVAAQFEALLVQQMLTSMRTAAKVDGAENSSYLDFYQEMHDKQMAQTIASKGHLGVAKMIMQQLPTSAQAAAEPALNAAERPLEVTATSSAVTSATSAAATTVAATATAAATTAAATSAEGSIALVSAPEKSAQGPTPNGIITSAAQPTATAPINILADNVTLTKVSDNDFSEANRINQANARWQNPDNYVADIWPQAVKAAQKLGVSAELLVAQSALETGWGKHTIKLADGQNSFNLFGIKASSAWQGAQVSTASIEFKDEALSYQTSSFRAYSSPEESLDDYVDFIQSNPRYQQALQHDGDDLTYITEVHKAGYATDPDYVEKIMSILNGKQINQSLAQLPDEGATYA